MWEMWGLDELIAGHAGSAPLAIAVSALLGLRHATDPDHLVAVSTLVATEPERPARRAGLLGLSWGLGHATTLTALGLPIVLFAVSLPGSVERAAEFLIGVVIAGLGLRLLRRWRAGEFHAHEHVHGSLVHRHLHAHTQAGHAHAHAVRSPLQAYGIGLVHGAGGSAAVTVLLLGAIPDRTLAATALLVFAVGTTLSMALLSSGLGYALGRRRVLRNLRRAAPALALFALAFGLWYAVAALA